MLDLKNCPFCDRAANVYHAFPQFEVGWTINCDHDSKCILRQAHGMFTCEATAEKAVAAWNRRALQAVGPEPAVALKPLVWNERGFAHTSTGIVYRVTHQPGYWRLEKIEGYSTLNSAHPTEDAAKSAAEADYAFRIRSALVATPPADEQEPLGRFGHHPDPAIDFETEVGDIEAELINIKAGFDNGAPPLAEIAMRIERAMTFRVGAVETAVAAKNRLREMEKEVADLGQPPAEPVVEVAAQYAERLANVLWEKHYRNAAPNWKPLTGDLIGILTQIDNMTSGRTLATKPAVKDDETVVEALRELLGFARALEKQGSKGTGGRRGGAIFAKAEAALAAKDGRS